MSTSGPILILQNLTGDGPGYLGSWLTAQGIPWVVLNAEQGEAYPSTMAGYAGLALLGGEMSANDPLPHLRCAERLILLSMDADIPVIGHCLGGQLMARALGAAVVASPRPEIGWQTMDVADSAVARAWFGGGAPRSVYHWHVESFGVPPGAELLASSPACAHQAFAIGRHIAMQFHVELDAFKLAVWSQSADPTFLRLIREFPSTVQSGALMRDQARMALPAQQALADRLYRRWLSLE